MRFPRRHPRRTPKPSDFARMTTEQFEQYMRAIGFDKRIKKALRETEDKQES